MRRRGPDRHHEARDHRGQAERGLEAESHLVRVAVRRGGRRACLEGQAREVADEPARQQRHAARHEQHRACDRHAHGRRREPAAQTRDDAEPDAASLTPRDVPLRRLAPDLPGASASWARDLLSSWHDGLARWPANVRALTGAARRVVALTSGRPSDP